MVLVKLVGVLKSDGQLLLMQMPTASSEYILGTSCLRAQRQKEISSADSGSHICSLRYETFQITRAVPRVNE